MKIILIGANGTIGKAVTKVLATDGHEIIAAGAKHGDVKVDIASEESIKKFFDQVGPFDGMICAAGEAYAGPLEKMTSDDAYKGIKSKLMGQVNLVLVAKDYLNANGFITLTSGSLAEEPAPNSADLGLVNGALNGFVINAALEMPKGIRLNVVSPSVITESIAVFGEPKDREGIPAAEVALAYQKTVNEAIKGQIVRAFGKAK